MSNVYVSATLASWSRKHVGDRINKGALRKALRDKHDLIEFNLVPTPVSRGGLATVKEAARSGVNQIVVRSDDMRDILAVITIRDPETWVVS